MKRESNDKVFSKAAVLFDPPTSAFGRNSDGVSAKNRTHTTPQLSVFTWVKNGTLELLQGAGFASQSFISSLSRQHTQQPIQQSRLATIERMRKHSRVVLNPKEIEIGALIEAMEIDQVANGIIEYSDFSYGMFSADENYSDLETQQRTVAYDHQVRLDFDEPVATEFQTLVAVIFDPIKPVGFATFEVALRHPVINEIDSFGLTFQWHLLYVMPSRRGEGFGLDLSLACSEISNDLLLGICNILPPGSKVQPAIHADLDSRGGELFIQEVVMSMRSAVQSHISACVFILPLQTDIRD